MEIYERKRLEEAMTWISVSERLPEKSKKVAIYWKNTDGSDVFEIALFWNGDFYECGVYSLRRYKVTHWHEFEPPKEEGK